MNARGRMIVNTLLRLRRQKLNAARSDMVAAQAVVTTARGRMRLLDESMGHCNAVARQAIMQSGLTRRVGPSRARMAGIRRELCACRADLAGAEEALVAKRAVLAEAIRRRRALRKAQRRAAAAELVARDKREQRALEEVHAAHAASAYEGRPAVVETI